MASSVLLRSTMVNNTRGLVARPRILFAPRMVTQAAAASSDKTYVDYTVYGDLSALRAEIKKPAFRQNTNGSVSLKQPGGMIYSLAPVNQNYAPGTGSNKFGWDRKVTMLLSPEEVALLRDWAVTMPSLCFTHTSKDGRIAKFVLGCDGVGKDIIITIDVKQPQIHMIGGGTLTIPVKPEQLKVLQSIADFSIPRLFGFDVMLETGPLTFIE